MYTAILIVFLQFSTGFLVVFTVQCLDPVRPGAQGFAALC